MITVDVDLKEMGQIIADIKQKVERLMEISGGMQCVDRNCDRILASIKMLEINISDVLEFLE
ncbi:MAG TPA: hypothetical protein DCD97_01645 [Firmicutes bacterium]|jgi:hypothetical protein|nr:hypothetical protein [Bacillota bacterium]HAA33994.1 hypothetical protein [Bacillota bacterium]